MRRLVKNPLPPSPPNNSKKSSVPELPFNTPPELSEWLYSYGVSAVYIIPVYKGHKVIHPSHVGDSWHGTKLFSYKRRDVVLANRSLKSALRWAATEFDIGQWGKPIGLNSRSYFPYSSLKFAAKEAPGFRHKFYLNTEGFRDVLD